MITELKIRKQIRKILLENEKTRRPGRGGYKREIQAAGALAQKNPGELMKRLGISLVSGKDDIEKLNNLMSQAVTGTESSEVMKTVFGEPQPRKDKVGGYKGLRIPVSVIPSRDARKYLEHTLVGAQASSTALFVDDIQIEILGNDILLYFSPKPYSWGHTLKARKQQEKKKDETDVEGKKHVIGEPDMNPDRESEDKDRDEASVSGMVSGPVTPLGTGATYPDKPQKKPQSAAEITGRAFGDAKPVKKKNKN